MTLRQLLKAVDLDKVFFLINKKDCKDLARRPTMEQTTSSYRAVVYELLEKPKARKYHMPILVRESEDWYDKHKYADVCFLNPKYVAPPKGYKPWGGNKNMPAKHYNCNLNKHNKTFAMGFTPWSKLIDTPIVNEAGYANESVLAEILWELTFYGWTENRVNLKVKEIEGSLDQAMKEIKAGKCIELPPKKKGGYKIVIPDCVTKQITEITNKLSKKRK